MSWRNKVNNKGNWVLCPKYVKYKKEGGELYPKEWNEMVEKKYGNERKCYL